ncbi:MAG: hypothetical protein V1773_17245 [bacterium]
MNKIKILSLLVFILSVKLFSQTDGNINNNEINKISVYFINGYGAIYQINTSPNTFYRLHIDIEADIVDSNFSRTSYAGSSRNKDIKVMLAPEIGCYLINKKYAKLYVGGGPLFSYGYKYIFEEYTADYVYMNGYPFERVYNSSKTIKNSYSVGIIGFMGIESRVFDNFSVFAEIDIKILRTWTKGETTMQYIYERYYEDNLSAPTDGYDWSMGLSTVRLGFSFLF